MSRREISPEEKAAVMGALMAGQSVSAAARQYKISRNTIVRWRAAAGLDNGASISQEKRDELGDLIGDVLKAILGTLRIQAEQFRDREWLSRQPASELGVLFGILADKAFRILEAAETAADEADEADEL